MLNLVATAPAGALPVWMVQFELALTRAGRPPAGEDDAEPMVELLSRTEGVCSAAVVPLQAGLAVALGLSAPDAPSALERALALVTSCARYAGIGELRVRRSRVVPHA